MIRIYILINNISVFYPVSFVLVIEQLINYFFRMKILNNKLIKTADKYKIYLNP
jgi:hypothetical protein